MIGIIDILGGIAFSPFFFSKKPVDLKQVDKIVLLRLDHIGDGIMARPAFRALHKKFPHAQIDLVTSAEMAPLFERINDLTTVIPAPRGWFSRTASFGQKFNEFWRLRKLLKNKRYDLGIDFRGDFRNILLMFLGGVKHRIGYGITGGGFLLNECVPYDTALHQVRLNLALLNSFHIAQDNKLSSFEYLQQDAQKFWERIGKPPPTTLLPRVIVHAGAGYPAKRWPFDNFRALMQKIDQEALAQIILIGTETENSGAASLTINSDRFIDLRGKTSLHDLPILFDVCDIFIGNDSGPAHIAAAQGLEIVLVASGTNDIRYWHPWTERLNLLQYEVPCSPCGQKTCPVENHPCVENISVDQVFDAFQSVVARLHPKS